MYLKKPLYKGLFHCPIKGRRYEYILVAVA